MADPLVAIENLDLGYGDKVIFRSINASEEGGHLIALLGSNGRGKSTLLRTIAGLEPIFNDKSRGSEGGKIFFKGRPLKDYTRKELSGLVGFVSANSERAEYLNVEDMVGLSSYFRTNWVGALNSEERHKIHRALKLVGLDGFEKRSCSSLSDGEYQRATIAGALVQQSEIILLDEPTAFLDVANKFLITKLLKSITADGKLIVFSTHDLQLALQVCDRLWIMTDGKFYDGTPQCLMEQGVMDKIFNVPGVRFDKVTKGYIFEPEE